jgi:sarcosine oxidase subunit gamma
VRESDRLFAPTSLGHYGAASPGVAFAETMIATAWNVQGPADRPAFLEAAQSAFGVAPPTRSNTLTRGNNVSALWLGPASWLIVAGAPLGDFSARRDALAAAGGALFDVTCARIGWMVTGPRAATVLAKGCPLDLHPRAFPPQSCAQSLFGHVNALFARDENGFTLMIARSFARDVWRMLCESAAQYGYDVKAAAPYR